MDFDDVLAGNARYAESFRDEGLPGRAGTGLAVLTCMDSRIDPLAVLGMRPGDVKVLRNAGAQVTDEVLRTLVVATTLLGVERVLVLPHTDCGMTKKDDDGVRAEVQRVHGIDAGSLDFSTIADQRAALERGVQRIRSWPFLPEGLPVAGGLYDVSTGRVEIVVP